MRQRFGFSLFWRIFALIWLAMALTVALSNITTYELIARERQSIERQAGLHDVADEAIRLQATGERGAVWRYLKEQGQRLDLHLVLLDPAHHDGDLPKRIRERIGAGWYRQQPAVIDAGEGFRLVAWPRAGGDGWLDPRLLRLFELSLTFCIVTLACWWVARRISKPLRHVEVTAEAIAAGDTSLRVKPAIAHRRDEIGALARAFNAMTEQLYNLLERQKHLLRDISHDLRTPLARQRIAIELARDSGADAELMASIQRQNERMETMTGQILTLYRLSEQGLDIQREPVRVVAVLNEVLQDVTEFAEHQRVDCHLTVAPGCQATTVLGDAGLLHRALDNILQNALDHTPPGQSIALSIGQTGQHLTCDIVDGGPGVSEDALAHLFEPFYRTDESRSGHGWGLGLAIARDIMRSHDGEIEARNDLSGGLRVTLIWPVFTGSDS